MKQKYACMYEVVHGMDCQKNTCHGDLSNKVAIPTEESSN